MSDTTPPEDVVERMIEQWGQATGATYRSSLTGQPVGSPLKPYVSQNYKRVERRLQALANDPGALRWFVDRAIEAGVLMMSGRWDVCDRHHIIAIRGSCPICVDDRHLRAANVYVIAEPAVTPTEPGDESAGVVSDRECPYPTLYRRTEASARARLARGRRRGESYFMIGCGDHWHCELAKPLEDEGL